MSFRTHIINEHATSSLEEGDQKFLLLETRGIKMLVLENGVSKVNFENKEIKIAFKLKNINYTYEFTLKE